MRHSYYRLCWHEFRGPLFLEYRHPKVLPPEKLFTPKGFFEHAASLRQAFAHCGRFSTAASRRSRARVAVPLLGITLSCPLPVIALVSHYLTNKLIGRGLIPERRIFTLKEIILKGPLGISRDFSRLCLTLGFIIHVLLTHLPLLILQAELGVRLACLIHAASVHPEPRSNSQKIVFETTSKI